MPLRSLAGTLAAVALVVSSSLAFAQDAGQDEVTLKNGGSVRGTVVSSDPGTSVKIIELGSKEPRVIPWSQVSDVEKGKYAPKAAPQPGAAGPGYGGPPIPVPPAGPPPARMGDPGVVKLHVESPEPVQIIQHEDAGTVAIGRYAVTFDRMHLVCTSPCDQPIDGRGQILTAGGDFPGVFRLNLDGRSGDANLTVRPGSWGRRRGGFVAISLGVAAIVGGATLLVIEKNSGPDFLDPHAQPASTAPGIGITTAGAVVLAGGIALVATSGSSFKLEGGGGGTETGAVKPRWWRGEF